MSIPIFPLRSVSGTSLTVLHRFPTDSQLLSHDADQWPDLMAEYQGSSAAGSRISFVAPVAGQIRFIERNLRGVPYFLLEFRPDAPMQFQAIPGWTSPVPRSLVVDVFALGEETIRLTILRDAIREFRRRGGHRIMQARFEGGRLRRADPIDLSDGDIADHARIALDGGYSPTVAKGQEILNTDLNIKLGMIHYEGVNPIAADVSWYWLDVHEYYTRLKAAFPEEDELRFPFRDSPSDAPFRIRYENNATTAISGGNRVNTLSGGLQQVRIYHPPTESIRATGSRFSARSLAVPSELFMLSPGAEAELYLSDSAINYRQNLFRDDENETRIWQSDSFSGREIILRFSSVAYSWPASRFEPYNLVLIADNNVGISFHMVLDLLDRVRQLTVAAMEEKARFADFIRQGENAVKIKMLENINRILNGMPADFRSDLRDGLDNPAFTAFSATYMGIKNDKDLAVRQLKDAMNPQFMAQFKADPTDTNFEIFNNAIDALENEYEGDEFIRSITDGFMVTDIYNADADPPVNFDWLKSLWNIQRRVRGPLVSFLFKMVRQDMFHHARIAHEQVRLYREAALYASRIRVAYRGRFGELFAIQSIEVTTTTSRQQYNIMTGRRETVTEKRAVNQFKLDTDAISDTTAGRTAGMSSGTLVADAFAHSLNVLNLLGSIWRVAEDMIRVFDGDPSYQELYNLTRDFVSLSSDAYHLFPSRHYAGISRGPGFANYFRGLSVVFGAVSMAKMLTSARELHTSGNYLAADLTAIAAAGSAVTISAEALVILGVGTTESTVILGVASAFPSPIAFIIISGAVISILFELMAAANRDPEIVVDFRHTLFGQDYVALESGYDGLPASVRNDFVQTYLRNHRNSWVRNLNRQVAHLNNYLWPLNARLTNREVTEPVGTRQVREINIYIFQARARAFSRVYFELFAPGTPDFGTKGTFIIDPRALREGGWFPIVIGTSPANSPTFVYQASAATRDSVSLQIRTYAPLTSPFANTNQGVMAVSFEESIEYVLEPDSPQLRELGISADLVRTMRSNPFNLRLHEAPFENTANKSQAFIAIS